MTDFIHFAKDTDDFLDHIDKIEQSWSRVIDGFAYVGESKKTVDFSRIVAIKTDDLEPEKYRWVKGKIVRNFNSKDYLK